MSLLDGVPPDGQAATTDLGDVTYPHDDHHRALAAAVEQLQTDLAELASGATAAYTEFLADSQTPYFVSADNSATTFPNGSASAEVWIGSADRIDGGGPFPSSPLPALASPFVGPGTVTDPIGYNEAAPFYTGPGAFKTLKTGVLSLQWAAQFEMSSAAARDALCVFDIYSEGGGNQQQRIGNAIHVRGSAAPTVTSSVRSQFGGSVLLTVLDFDLLDEDPYSFPTYPSFANLYAMQAGVVPLGWDIWPTIGLQHPTASVENFEIDHLGIQITKIA